MSSGNDAYLEHLHGEPLAELLQVQEQSLLVAQITTATAAVAVLLEDVHVWHHYSMHHSGRQTGSTIIKRKQLDVDSCICWDPFRHRPSSRTGTFHGPSSGTGRIHPHCDTSE